MVVYIDGVKQEADGGVSDRLTSSVGAGSTLILTDDSLNQALTGNLGNLTISPTGHLLVPTPFYVGSTNTLKLYESASLFLEADDQNLYIQNPSASSYEIFVRPGRSLKIFNRNSTYDTGLKVYGSVPTKKMVIARFWYRTANTYTTGGAATSTRNRNCRTYRPKENTLAPNFYGNLFLNCCPTLVSRPVRSYRTSHPHTWYW